MNPPVNAMTNTQLYILIAVPILFNFGVVIAFFMIINSNINAQFVSFRSEMQARFEGVFTRLDSLERREHRQ